MEYSFSYTTKSLSTIDENNVPVINYKTVFEDMFGDVFLDHALNQDVVSFEERDYREGGDQFLELPQATSGS